jgi:hypothetical protein
VQDHAHLAAGDGVTAENHAEQEDDADDLEHEKPERPERARPRPSLLLIKGQLRTAP